MGVTVAVLGAVGGVGASTFAAALAWVAGGLLVDLDPVGGGVDVLLGIEHTPGARWSGLRLGGGTLDPALLAGGLPAWRGVRVLAADRSPPVDAVAPVCASGAERGTVVADLPRVPCELREAAVAVADVVLVLARCTVRSLAAARAVVPTLDAPATGLVLRRGEVPLAEVRDALPCPVVAVLPASCRVGLASRPPPRRLARAAAGLLDGLREGRRP